jgi:hypothetical protein
MTKGTSARDSAAVPAVKTFCYAIQVAGSFRPVLTVSGSEDHRAEWIARAVAIAEEAATGDEHAMVWEAEIEPNRVGDAAYVLIYPAVNDI